MSAANMHGSQVSKLNAGKEVESFSITYMSDLMPNAGEARQRATPHHDGHHHPPVHRTVSSAFGQL